MNFDFQMIKKVRDLLMDDNSRALYNLGGCVDNEGDNILLHIKFFSSLFSMLILVPNMKPG